MHGDMRTFNCQIETLTARAPRRTICASRHDATMTDSPSATLPASVPAPPVWWRHDIFLARFVADLACAEFAQARPGRGPVRVPPDPGFDLARDLGADSLDLLALGTAFAQALHLDRAAVDEALLASTRLGDWMAVARAALDAGGGALTFRTSGSSGAPKRCTHLLATLWEECDVLAQLVPGTRRVLAAVPAHHIYGFLLTTLLPLRLALDRADDVIDLRASTPATAVRLARAGDLIVGHPGWWEAVRRLDPRFAAGVNGVTSTAPCPDALADALAGAGLRLVQVYGSSETAGVGWRERAGEAFTLLPYWSRAGDPASLVRRLPDGSDAVYPLQDRLAWDGARAFRPGGRLDGAVQIGGTNVFPAYVADVLRLHPAVLDAAVRPMRPDEGTRLKAFVVPREAGLAEAEGAAPALARELDAFVAARLAAPERPAAWTFGARLPRQASGKPADWIVDAG
jgi:long-chain acyl-CoA synthetase